MKAKFVCNLNQPIFNENQSLSKITKFQLYNNPLNLIWKLIFLFDWTVKWNGCVHGAPRIWTQMIAIYFVYASLFIKTGFEQNGMENIRLRWRSFMNCCSTLTMVLDCIISFHHGICVLYISVRCACLMGKGGTNKRRTKTEKKASCGNFPWTNCREEKWVQCKVRNFPLSQMDAIVFAFARVGFGDIWMNHSRDDDVVEVWRSWEDKFEEGLSMMFLTFSGVLFKILDVCRQICCFIRQNS